MKPADVVGGLIVAAAVIWFFARPPTTASNTALEAPAVANNAPLDPEAVVARIKTLSYVGKVQPPSPTNDNEFVVSVSADSLFDGGDKAESVLHTIHNHASSTPYSGVSVDVSLKLVDRYGRKSEPPLFRLTYAKGEIDKINFDNIVSFQVLNLAQVASLDPAARHIAADECKGDGDFAKYADVFCASAADADPATSIR